jgi:drug/metabolite transporter (DMT)-like permease
MLHISVIFALLSLFFAGLNDVFFKKYAQKERSRGMYVLGIGIIWTVLQVFTFILKDVPFALDSITFTYGLTAGLFLTLSNILLLHSLTRINISLGSTIYRLNTIGVVILSFFVLHEPFGPIKFIGVTFGIVAVLFLYQKRDNTNHINYPLSFFWAVIIASIFRATYGVVAKAGILAEADPELMLLLISSSWIFGGACYAKYREKRFRFTRKKAAYSILSGILVFLIVNFLMLAIEHGQASVVIPIANMSFVIALFISVILRMERLTLRKCCAIGSAAVSIILLAQV